ncbi:cytochrome c(L), periplasmic [Xanthobacter dioxanivorans]|uniref:Cytochrome c-L n=1 Tax=Xanthobacter dioxanivorans TaxID=2528964 RepID=A0A974PUK6_9HYPH|nr:cytochrome c(L), periplasmic [Xanthobacter dioxanivorans]QRG09826.1 cytochrome c(L), periplasmic [Xanthobacter dioxanivorans]
MKGLVAIALVSAFTLAAHATLSFTNTITGQPLDLSEAMEEGRDTEAVKKFLSAGVNPYLENKTCLPKAKDLFLSMCSGCHGHYGEGKIGPGLNDAYWTYPKNMTDQGLFETIFGGAQGQMGPMYGALNLDEMLLVMAWVRHIYKDDPNEAVWLSPAQRAAFKPFDDKEDHTPPLDQAPVCKVSATSAAGLR